MDDVKIRRKALRAIQAVTAGAMIFAGVACTGEEEPDPDTGFNLYERDTEESGDVDNGEPDAVADVGSAECNAEESTGVCNEGCTVNNDIDCCHESGGCWDFGTCDEFGCAVPGPFVPPRMVA